MKYSDGSSYIGKFQEDKRHGKGRMVWKDKAEYDGYWRDDIREGLAANEEPGRYTWSNGVTYNGDWVNGKREGTGEMTWPDGSSYRGAFKDNMKHGEGVFNFGDGSGSIYEGSWV